MARVTVMILRASRSLGREVRTVRKTLERIRARVSGSRQ